MPPTSDEIRADVRQWRATFDRVSCEDCGRDVAHAEMKGGSVLVLEDGSRVGICRDCDLDADLDDHGVSRGLGD